MKKSLFDVQHPMFRPLWRRILIVALTFGWTVFEILHGTLFWAFLFGAAGVYLAHQFFMVFDPKDPEEKDQE